MFYDIDIANTACILIGAAQVLCCFALYFSCILLLSSKYDNRCLLFTKRLNVTESFLIYPISKMFVYVLIGRESEAFSYNFYHYKKAYRRNLKEVLSFFNITIYLTKYIQSKIFHFQCFCH